MLVVMEYKVDHTHLVVEVVQAELESMAVLDRMVVLECKLI